MYKSYKLLIMTVNVKGGENETIEHLYKEVDGQLVPMTEEEATLKLLKEVSTTGGNASTQSIKGVLINPDGYWIKEEEIKKPVVTPIDTKKLNAEKALADYMANPTDENLEKIKTIVTE